MYLLNLLDQVEVKPTRKQKNIVTNSHKLSKSKQGDHAEDMAMETQHVQKTPLWSGCL